MKIYEKVYLTGLFTFRSGDRLYLIPVPSHIVVPERELEEMEGRKKKKKKESKEERKKRGRGRGRMV
jgi:hypothetical protein